MAAAVIAQRFRHQPRLIEQFVTLQHQLFVPGRAVEAERDRRPLQPLFATGRSSPPAQARRPATTISSMKGGGPARWSSQGK
jgi:hypothetical protein